MPFSISVSMKLVVPFTIPSTRCTCVTTSDSRSTLITGIAAQTLASKRSCTPAARAVSNSSALRCATSCLFAVTTGLPARSRSSTYSPVGSTPPITSATTAIDGSLRISSKLVVSSPSTGKSRCLSRSRTSARTIRSRWPVARSMSSPLSWRKRATEAPTVPYPSSATGTSTLATDFGLLAAHQRAQLLADLLDPLVCGLRAQLVQARFAGLHLVDPLAREDALADVGEELAHVLAHVLVDHLRPAREIAVFGRVGDRVPHPGEAALPDQVDDQLQLVE